MSHRNGGEHECDECDEENYFNGQFIKLGWMHKSAMSAHLLHEGFASGRWLNS